MKMFQTTLTAFAAIGMLTFAIGCQPPATDEIDVTIGTEEVDEIDSNTTMGVETPDSNTTLGAETPDSETP
ncbi:hypothetical protein Q31b_56550 [Novipirellula aureliae]|uniref:Secreted protein n=1 Tax=Novipirellula aureliae TaxID=2527966 RepID=A0A5C6DE58_9BACT|nr:hypothetical protein [Novipirellula aureliae]TWU34184.1 hypothetical protein Q31b_56550 [Novipirellula aureliae]